MKPRKTTKRMKKIASIMTVLAITFVVLSFVGFYLSSDARIEETYTNLTKLVLVFNLTLLMVFRELWKQEKNRFKYSNEYTFMVSRK